jgi:hypothetical protein
VAGLIHLPRPVDCAVDLVNELVDGRLLLCKIDNPVGEKMMKNPLGTAPNRTSPKKSVPKDYSEHIWKSMNKRVASA